MRLQTGMEKRARKIAQTFHSLEGLTESILRFARQERNRALSECEDEVCTAMTTMTFNRHAIEDVRYRIQMLQANGSRRIRKP